MTTEDDFQCALYADHSDWQTRLVFADWLQEQGDVRAEGYRALGILCVWPAIHIQDSVWGSDAHPSRDNPDWFRFNKHLLLPADWFHLIPFREDSGDWENSTRKIWVRFPLGRREAEDAAALAFSRLPGATRAALLCYAFSAHSS